MLCFVRDYAVGLGSLVCYLGFGIHPFHGPLWSISDPSNGGLMGLTCSPVLKKNYFKLALSLFTYTFYIGLQVEDIVGQFLLISLVSALYLEVFIGTHPDQKMTCNE